MKSIVMKRSFDYRPNRRVVIAYKAGQRYDRVPEAAVREIVKAGAGAIIEARQK